MRHIYSPSPDVRSRCPAYVIFVTTPEKQTLLTASSAPRAVRLYFVYLLYRSTQRYMISADQAHNLQLAFTAAKSSGHIFPAYATCEAALESSWFTSTLCVHANNLFGQKAGYSTTGLETTVLPTREYLNGQWVTVSATWPKFPNWTSCFESRMTLLRHSPTLYSAALSATTGQQFITEVSRHWSTDPDRAHKILQIHDAHKDLLNA